MTTQIITSLIFSFLLCTVLTPIVRRIALKRGWIARPSKDRWHQKPTALMGGIAIFAGVAFPLAFYGDFISVWHSIFRIDGNAQTPSLIAAMLLGGSFLFLIGLIDDFRNIKPYSKLIAQILAAALIAFLGFRLHWFESLTLDTMATLFWIVGITNAFNLIDNMDGLCTGVALIAALFLAVLFYPDDPTVTAGALIFVGALGGFLIYNFNPAKIFMGDSGSLVIGFCISVLLLNYVNIKPPSKVANVAVPVLILLVPILDTTLVTVIRILSGRKASTGGKDHTSHRLVLMGFSEKSAVLFLYGVGTIAGLAAIFVHLSDSMTSPAVIIPLVMAIVLMGVYLSQLRVYPELEFSRLRGRSFTPVLVELTYKRHMLMVVLDFIIVAFCYYLAYRLRFEGHLFSGFFAVFLKSLPIVIGCKLSLFFLTGIYHGLWRFISTSDVILYFRASLLGSLAAIAAVTLIYRFEHFSKGVFIIDFVLTTGLMLAVRGSFRFFLETQNRHSLSGDKVIIYGAGRGGELLLREILNNKFLKVKPVGFIDDDVLKIGKRIQGYPILGGFKDLADIHATHRLDGLLISFNNSWGSPMDTLEAVGKICRENNIYLKRFKLTLEPVEDAEINRLNSK